MSLIKNGLPGRLFLWHLTAENGVTFRAKHVKIGPEPVVYHVKKVVFWGREFIPWTP